MKLFSKIASLIILGAMLGTNVQASGFRLTPSIGVIDFDSDIQTKSAAIPSITLGYNATRNLGVEVLFGGTSSDRKDVVDRNVDILIANFDAVYRFNNVLGLYPLIFGGVGLNYLKPYGTINATNPNGDQAYTQATLNAGIGAEYCLSQQFAIRGDVRDLYVMNGGRNNLLANIGLTIYFPSKTPKPVRFVK